MKPHVHAESSAKKFGGKPNDYLEIHKFLDSSKATMCDHRHRALTHNSWFIAVVLPRVFGELIINSDGTQVSVVEIGEQHVLEDFRGNFVPSVQDWLAEIEYQPWMDNGNGMPPSMGGAKVGGTTREQVYDGPKPPPVPLPPIEIPYPFPVIPVPSTPWIDDIPETMRPRVID